MRWVCDIGKSVNYSVESAPFSPKDSYNSSYLQHSDANENVKETC